jgi:hypothetical protein
LALAVFFWTLFSHFRLFCSIAMANQARFQSTKAATPEVSTTFLTIGKKTGGFSKNWLSDGVMGAASALCGGMCIYYLTSCVDVQINTNKRSSIIRTWGA